MDALLFKQNGALHPTMHNPAGALHLFYEEQIKAMVLEWQSDQRTELLNEILLRTQPLITGVLLSRSKHTEDFDELLSLLRLRIWKKLPKYDSAQGPVFTYFTLIAHQCLDEVWAKRRRYQERYNTTGLELLDCRRYAAVPETYLSDDIVWRIYTVRTIFTDPFELESQRWLVRGLLDSGFKLRRHEAADATVMVYGLRPRRARAIHDYTMLEIRRTLLPVTEIPKITPDSLKGTRAAALRKFADQLSPGDFAKLIYLMRNLAPAIIDDLNHVLNGHPQSKPLFDGNYA